MATTRNKFDLTQTILHALLDQAEQPERERVVRVRLPVRMPTVSGSGIVTVR